MKQAKVITKTEMKRLLAVISEQRHAARNRMAVMLSHYAGMRVREIAALNWEHVLDQDRQIRDQFVLAAADTKTKTARTVFVGSKLKSEIQRYLKSFDKQPQRETPFLKTPKNRAFSANTLCQLFGIVYADAAIDGASSHSGRRSFITKLAHSGVSPKVIMTLAGHKYLATTQRYIDVNDEMMRQAVEVL